MKTHTNHTELWHKTSMYLAWSLVWKNSSKSKNIMEKEEGIKSHEIKKLSQIHTKTWWNWLAYNTNSSAAASVDTTYTIIFFVEKNWGHKLNFPPFFMHFLSREGKYSHVPNLEASTESFPLPLKKYNIYTTIVSSLPPSIFDTQVPLYIVYHLF